MSKLNKIAYLCSSRGKIDFENLLVIEKQPKPSTIIKHFFFQLLSVKLGGGNNKEGWIFSKSSQSGVTSGNKLKLEGKIENSLTSKKNK